MLCVELFVIFSKADDCISLPGACNAHCNLVHVGLRVGGCVKGQ